MAQFEKGNTLGTKFEKGNKFGSQTFKMSKAWQEHLDLFLNNYTSEQIREWFDQITDPEKKIFIVYKFMEMAQRRTEHSDKIKTSIALRTLNKEETDKTIIVSLPEDIFDPKADISNENISDLL